MTKNRLAILAIAVGTLISARAQAQSVDAFLKAAELKIKAGDIEAARDIYSRIIKQHPADRPEVYVFRAQTEEALSDRKAESADYTKALALVAASQKPFPSDIDVVEIYAKLGMAKEELRDSKGAVAAFTAGLARFPNDPFLLQFRGDAHFLYGDCAAAAADYSKAIASPDGYQRPPFIERSRAYICTGDLVRASEDYRAAAAQSENAAKQGGMENLSEWDLEGWAATSRVVGRAAADKMLAARLAQSQSPTDRDTAYDAAQAFLGRSEMAVIADDVAAIKAKAGDKTDTLDGDIYYFAGLKAAAEGQDEAAVAHFQKVLALHDADLDQRLLSRAWIAEIGRHPAKAAR